MCQIKLPLVGVGDRGWQGFWGPVRHRQLTAISKAWTAWCVQVLRSPKEAFAWRERCEKCVCLQGDYVEKWLHFQLPVVSSFLNKLGDLRTWTHHVTRRSAFFGLSHPRTHIFHVHNAITACLTQLSMNFDWFHATQVEESDNHALFFECKRRHFSIKNTTATRPRHKHSTGSTVLPLGLAQP